MCRHHWMIDSQNFGVCKLCHDRKDFQPGIKQFFGLSKLPREEEKLVRSLIPASDYPVQGIIRNSYQYRKIDYCFSVDNIV